MILVLPDLAPERLEAVEWPEGSVRRVSPMVGSPEAAWLGLPPRRMADGPLVVAALGAEPPERSLQFHLSWLGLVDGQVVEAPPPTASELAVLPPLLPKLNTKRLTALFGESVDHALVLEGFYDLGTTPKSEAVGKELQTVLPEGEMEETLRRYLDDSVNLLSELDFNRRRRDEDRPPLNLLFPWGHGAPERYPNLALHRGEPLRVEAASLRVRGLARLVGYRPVRLVEGMETDWAGLADRQPGIAVVSGFAVLADEEAEWLLKERRRLDRVEGLTIVAAGMILEAGKPATAPFRAEVAEDRSVPQIDLWQAIDRILTPESHR